MLLEIGIWRAIVRENWVAWRNIRCIIQTNFRCTSTLEAFWQGSVCDIWICAWEKGRLHQHAILTAYGFIIVDLSVTKTKILHSVCHNTYHRLIMCRWAQLRNILMCKLLNSDEGQLTDMFNIIQSKRLLNGFGKSNLVKWEHGAPIWGSNIRENVHVDKCRSQLMLDLPVQTFGTSSHPHLREIASYLMAHMSLWRHQMETFSALLAVC